MHQEVEQSVDGELQLVVGAPAQAVMVGAGAWYTHGDAEPVVDAPPLEFCSNTLSLSLSGCEGAISWCASLSLLHPKIKLINIKLNPMWVKG